MGGGGGGGTSTTTMIAVPPWAQDEVAAYGTAAYNLWQGSAIAAYSGDIVAAQPVDELEGIDGLATRGRYGDQVISKAIDYLDDVINDGFLSGLKANFLSALANVTGKATASFADVSSRIGRKLYYQYDPDSTLLAQTLAAGYPATYTGRMEALIYAENYDRERGIQDHALGFGVEMGKHAAIDAEALRRAGLYAREYLQGSYEMNHKLWLEGQEIEVVKLEIFGNCLRALTGSQQTTTENTPQSNKMMNAVGGAIVGGVAGWYIGASIGWLGGPLGALAGAVIGGIAGWFL